MYHFATISYTGIHTLQKQLNFFVMTRKGAEGSPETSITDEVFTAVVMTIVMGKRSYAFPLRRLADIQSHSAQTQSGEITAIATAPPVFGALSSMNVNNCHGRLLQYAHSHRGNVQGTGLSVWWIMLNASSCSHCMVYIWFTKPSPRPQKKSKTDRGQHLASTV